ncbi:hypothetical protein BJV74DRAFT_949333 [Russula compacta]|nr:hypothetical protein BJV74DRAFT_949333 [Russula compacta]
MNGIKTRQFPLTLGSVNYRRDSPERPSKRAKGVPGMLASRRIVILQAKLSHTDKFEIIDLAKRADATVVSSPDEADIIITAIGMRKRLERHLNWNIAKAKGFGDTRLATRFHGAGPPHASDVIPPASLLPPPVPPTPVEFDHTARFCCSRASPLVCVNQPLCDMLDLVRRSRELESNERSALSYARAIVAIKAFPRKITAIDHREVRKLPFIGAKIFKMIDEYFFHGHIPEVDIPREEVEAVHATIMDHLNAIEPGCVSTATAAHLLREYHLGRLRPAQCTLTSEDRSEFHEYDAPRTAQRHSLNEALTVYRTPNNGRYHRVDLTFTLPETYWTAVVGWTGGTMFQTDLRLSAKTAYAG